MAITFPVHTLTSLSDSLGAASRDHNDLVTIDSPNREPDRFRPEIRPSSESTLVSLATLQRDGVQFSAGEAVAIGQALCLALMTAQFRRRHDTDSDAGRIVRPLNTETVSIDPTSRLGVSADDPGDEATAIHYVGRILSEIVPDDTRRKIQAKVIAKALTTPTQFGSIAELSHALAKFEKPRGRELIQAVYERWQNGEVSPEVRSEAAPLVESRPVARIRLDSPPKAVAAAALVIFVVLVAASATVLITQSYAEESHVENGATAVELGRLLESRPVSPLTTGLARWSVAKEDRPAIAISLSPVKQEHLPRRAAIVPVAAKMERLAPAPLTPSISRDESLVPFASPMLRPAVEAPSTLELVAVPADESVAPPPGSSNAVASRNNGIEISAPNSAVKTPPVRATSAANAPVYTSRDAQVVPPMPILPRLLAGLEPSSPGIRLDALVIAVVVDENGRAYSVSGLNSPQNVGEFMLLTSALAAVKQWEFEPAYKDGVPVKYRLIVPLRSVTESAR